MSTELAPIDIEHHCPDCWDFLRLGVVEWPDSRWSVVECEHHHDAHHAKGHVLQSCVTHDGFSTATCDCCGTRVAGARYAVLVWEV